MARAIMIQGTGSNVGKSLLVAGLCRHFSSMGLKVRPFKPQNMSNNAAVTEDGGEIGRAQALQARAAGIAPSIDMNPVLLKPETDQGSQVIVQGARFATVRARDYAALKPKLLAACLQSFQRLSQQADIVIVEGAGSPAEINLRAGDIANMGFAEAANLSVILAGDIDRGGVIAQLVGTKTILPPQDAVRIKGFLVNKFRGDVSLFKTGLQAIVEYTDWSSLGVLPWFEEAWRLPAEDIMDLRSTSGTGVKIAVPRLNRIANFDDLDPLSAEPGVSVEVIPSGQPLPGDADLILIPGSKSTISDLAHFRDQGWDIDLAAHIRRGGRVLGLCGGYQMLGYTLADPEGIEGPAVTVKGLGHLNVATVMTPQKQLTRVTAQHRESATSVFGYEIHVGQTTGPDCTHPWLDIAGLPHGASARGGQIQGCYIHGLFESDAFRRAYLAQLGTPSSDLIYGESVEKTLDDLAVHMARHLDLASLKRMMVPV